MTSVIYDTLMRDVVTVLFAHRRIATVGIPECGKICIDSLCIRRAWREI